MIIRPTHPVNLSQVRRVFLRAACGAAPRRSAFTLIELVMVLVVIAITTAIAVPTLSGSTHRRRSDAAADRLASDIRLVMADAQSSGAPRTIAITSPARRYTVADVSDPLGSGAASYSVDLAASPYSITAMRASVPAINFTPYGVCTTPGNVQLETVNELRTITFTNAGAVAITRQVRGQLSMGGG